MLKTLKTPLKLTCLVAVSAICLAGNANCGKQQLKTKTEAQTQPTQQKGKEMTPQLQIKDTKMGNGPSAEKGQTIAVHYTGRLENGKVFDSSYNRGEPIRFTLGEGQVIKGWDQGLEGMKTGGKRTLTIPPELGYGKRGARDAIPPNATLIFDVELVGAGS